MTLPGQIIFKLDETGVWKSITESQEIRQLEVKFAERHDGIL